MIMGKQSSGKHPKLLEVMRDRLQLKHYSIRAETQDRLMQLNEPRKEAIKIIFHGPLLTKKAFSTLVKPTL